MYNPDKKSIRRIIAFASKTFPVFFFIILLVTQQLLAQVTDDFTDGNFTTNPIWNGSTSNLTVNTSFQLQLNATVAGSSHLSLGFDAMIDNYEWEFYVKQSFAPSGGNFSRFYLVSDQSDLSTPLNGYYLQFGEAGSLDAVELFRQSGSTSVSVCRATNGRIATSFEIRVKVTRNNSGLWQVYVDYAGGSNFVLESSGTDLTHITSAYSGVFYTYTLTNVARFYYDDIGIRPLNAQDTVPPEILSVNILSDTELNIVFTEAMDVTTAENIANFVLSGPYHTANARLLTDQKTAQIILATPLENGSNSTLTISNLEDLSGNAIVRKEIEVRYFKLMPVKFRDIIISEIFPDPSPQVTLPASEFLELYNRSENPIELNNWRITDGFSTGVLQSFILLPGKYLVLSTSNSSSEFLQYGPCVGLANFPTLNNASDRLKILDGNGFVIDSVNYSASWYKDEDKQAGGWTLERIDPENVCEVEENWTASTDASGGTPGKINSVHQIVSDTQGPKLLEAIQIHNNSLQLVFDEKLNALSPDLENFFISPSMNILEVAFADNLYNKINVVVSGIFDTTITYSISAANIFDCPGNAIQAGHDKGYLNIDVIPPAVKTITAESSTTVSVIFSEKVSTTTAGTIANYFIETLGHPASIVLKEGMRSVILHYSAPFANGSTFAITIRDAADLSGNVMEQTERTFVYFQPHPVDFKDVIITEIFADPAPGVGLPDAEFVELFNRSDNPVDLSGWSVTDGMTSAVLPAYILLPGKYLIITSVPARSQFLSFGEVVAINSFPALNNSGDPILLEDEAGIAIDSVKYDLSWYQHEEKAEGGWSLELIDPENICAEENNWNASESETGGTPGKRNSVYANNPDSRGPRLLSVSALNSKYVLLTFDEKLKNEIPSPESFSFDPLLKINEVSFAGPSLDALTISVSDEIKASTKYRLRVEDVYDCPGNIIDSNFSKGTIILPEPGLRGDIIVNELLFNPRPTGVDFVEIYNHSDKTIDLKGWSIGNLSAGRIENSKIISDENVFIHPKEYRVFSENTNVLKGEYLDGKEENFFQMDLPPFNDDSGSVVLVSEQDSVMDVFNYSDKMHAVFLQDDQGVSLERISFDRQDDESQNWRSASSTSGFATPGYVNSNLRVDGLLDDGSVVVEPEIFQPFVYNHDFAQIKFNFKKGGSVANVKIIDPQGRVVKQIAQNSLLGTEGFFRWDGDLDNGSRARTGYYLVWFEVFDSNGSLKTYKKRVVVY